MIKHQSLFFRMALDVISIPGILDPHIIQIKTDEVPFDFRGELDILFLDFVMED